MLYFILADGGDLQEIAKHADNQHFHYSHPKPTPNGALLVFTLRCAAQKKWCFASLHATLRCAKKMVLRSSSCCAAQKKWCFARLHATLRCAKKMVLRSSSRYATLRKKWCFARLHATLRCAKKMVLRKKLCLLTADF